MSQQPEKYQEQPDQYQQQPQQYQQQPQQYQQKPQQYQQQPQQYQQQPQQYQQQPQQYQQQPQQYYGVAVLGGGLYPDQSHNTALILLIIGFVFPLFFYINVCLHIGSKNPKSKLYAQISLVFAIICTIIFASFFF